MASQHDNNDNDITDQELDKLDSELLEIEILYRTRCVQAPQGSNVVVREIENKDS